VKMSKQNWTADFVPFRVHLVSGKAVEVTSPAAGWMLQNALLVLHDAPRGVDAGYDVISLRNIERLEQLLPPSESDVVK